MSRCEQLGQQILIYDRPVPVEEIVAKIDGVDRDAVVKAAARLRASRPTVAALGPIAKLESYDRIAERLA
jgi:predicted Zn-dependent peptidase